MPEVSTTYNYQYNLTITQLLPDFYYISGPTGNIAVYISENGAEPELYYTITDHLGSIVAVTDADGEIIEEQRYDPWGNYRNPLTGEPEETPQLTMLFRGYTGHEMLPEFGLINMNGRLYDPVIARVLSPDNNVQNPYNPQNYNRYSYCLNNPLSYTDPSGEFVFTVLLTPIGLTPVGMILDAACWGAVTGGAGYTLNMAFSEDGFENWGRSDFWKAVGVGAITGAVTGGFAAAGSALSIPAQNVIFQSMSSTVSSTVSSLVYNERLTIHDVLGGFTGGLIGGFVGEGIGNLLFGNSPSHIGGVISGMISGATGGFVGGTISHYFTNDSNDFSESMTYGIKTSISGGIYGGVVGGFQAARYGRNIWTGQRKTTQGTCPLYLGPVNPRLESQWRNIEPRALTITINKVNIPIFGWKFGAEPYWVDSHWPEWQQGFPFLIPFVPWISK